MMIDRLRFFYTKQSELSDKVGEMLCRVSYVYSGETSEGSRHSLM